MPAHPALSRTESFCARFGLRLPILLAPMAGASAPSLSIAVANAGGLGAAGALLMAPAAITAWAAEVRAGTEGPFQLNLWIPDPAPARDAMHEAKLRAFLAGWGPEIPPDAGDATPPDFAGQCEALLKAAPPIVSSVMGLYPPAFVRRLKAHGICWWANVSTVAEARAAEHAGADVIVAQGMEAGGHRGCFEAARAETELVGLFALVPAVVGCSARARRRHGRHRRPPRGRGCADPRCKRGADWHRVPALTRSAIVSGVGRRAGTHAAGGHDPHACLQRPCRAEHCDYLRTGRSCPNRSHAGPLPGAAGPDPGDAG